MKVEDFVREKIYDWKREKLEETEMESCDQQQPFLSRKEDANANPLVTGHDERKDEENGQEQIFMSSINFKINFVVHDLLYQYIHRIIIEAGGSLKSGSNSGSSVPSSNSMFPFPSISSFFILY